MTGRRTQSGDRVSAQRIDSRDRAKPSLPEERILGLRGNKAKALIESFAKKDRTSLLPRFNLDGYAEIPVLHHEIEDLRHNTDILAANISPKKGDVQPPTAKGVDLP